MTKKQIMRIDSVQEMLGDCKTMISGSYSLNVIEKKVKKHVYIPFSERLSTIKSDLEFKKLRYYI
jgi:hypothetical protein